MSEIEYNYTKRTVRQFLGVIHSGLLAGEFFLAVDALNNKFALYSKYTKVAHDRVDVYLDGAKVKSVKFDRLLLVWVDTYDNVRELHVIGERRMDADEIAVYENKCTEAKQREIAELRRLRALYPNE